MPVYGVEKYLDESIKSVLAQTLTDFELILVDDCSPDSCPARCDEWAKKDPRVRVIHKEKNEGLALARNTGLDAAVGRYVLFADSDDRLKPETLAVCDARMNIDTDVLVFGVDREFEDAGGDTVKTETLSAAAYPGEKQANAAEAFLLLGEAHIFPFAWNKLYSRSFLNSFSLRFENAPLIEDFLFNIAVFDKTDAVKIIPDALYRYRKPAHETLASRYDPAFYALCRRKYMLERGFLAAHGKLNRDTHAVIAETHLKHVISVAVRNRGKKAGLSFKEQREKIREMLTDELTLEALGVAEPAGLKMKAAAFLMRRKSTLGVYILAALAEKALRPAKAR